MDYPNEQLNKLHAHYTGLKDKASYDAFVRSAYDLLQRINADAYHVRMALTRGKSMMEFGSRAAYRHSEGVGGIRVGLLMMETDVPQVPQELKPNVHYFQPRGETAYVKFTVPTWTDIPTDLLALNEKAMRWEYARIKDTKLVEIRRGSGTDNEALRYAVVHGVPIQELPGPPGLIMVNITWNSNDWKGPSQDRSDHGYVKDGNTPIESWNFDLENPRNPPGQVFGFVQHTAPPRLFGKNNLVIFHSAGKVVGFYGEGRLLKDKPIASDGNPYNIIGERSLSLVLGNKLEDIKAKGYLENKERMGQNGFIYLEQPQTALRMIDEALVLNTSQSSILNNLRNWLTAQTGSTAGTTITRAARNMSFPLNRIFYGPPGTGKTFHTVGAAVAVCDPEYYAQHKDDHNKLRERFNTLLIRDWDSADGRIGFCTFHQSYSYEDFVEGIKPMVPEEGDKFVKYAIREGILKLMARRASGKSEASTVRAVEMLSFTPQEFDRAEFYKLSLGAVYNKEDEEIYHGCIRNNVIAVGYLGQHDLSDKTEQQINELPLQPDQTSSSASQANYFRHYLKKGDYVVVTRGNLSVRAIGKVTGDYRYAPDLGLPYPHVRDVEWLLKDQDIPWEEIYTKKFVQRTIYKLIKEDIKRDFFVKEAAIQPKSEEARNFVLIIDEINRGNVAGIFGELITLIEENKRKGKPEALEVTLPYTQEPFSIPDNLYIIGTMNTADRSVEALDAALRRRFSFKPMMPEPGKLKPLQGSTINITTMLERINARLVQLLDEDHQIGHSHFWDLHKETDPLPALRRVFKDKVIPQLEEYFHRDRAKLQLVLGQRFVHGADPADDLFLGDETAVVHEPRMVYAVTPMSTWDETAFRSLYEKV
jgi:hypothetical protein